MSHVITLTTRDQQSFEFSCSTDQDLVTAAEAAQILLPAQCRQGSCGACHASVRHGQYHMGEHSAQALPAGSADHGGVLLCRTHADSDLAIELPFTADRVLHHAVPTRQAEILSLDKVADNTVRLVLRLAVDEQLGSAAEFEPGQFMELHIPGTDLRRAYSLANISNWDGLLEFFIRLQEGGRFSNYLRDSAQVGAPISVRGPQGAFGLLADSLRPRWFVAGGTGLAPMLSMLRRMADYQELHDARLIFGVTKASELFAQDLIAELQSSLPQLQVDYCVWQASPDWQGITGTPADALQAALSQSQASPDIYLCGPAPMISACEAVAAQHGIPQQQVLSERF